MNDSKKDRGPDPTEPTPPYENRAMRRARESVERKLRRKGKTVRVAGYEHVNQGDDHTRGGGYTGINPHGGKR